MQLLILALAAIAVFSRRPDALLNPQFYAEDGAVWYAQAYNLGWLHSLTLPAGGYLNTLPRLIAGLSLLLPLQSAPLLMNLFGIFFQLLPVFVLLSSRCSAWSPLSARFLQAFIYIALPNSREVHVVLTNAQWHLALTASILVFADPPTTRTWKAFDIAVLTLCGLTGPFCLLLLPLATFFWWRRRQPWSLTVIGTLALSAAFQIAELTYPGRPARLVGHLGATPLLFFRLLAGQVFAAAIVGENALALHATAFKAVAVALVGLAVMTWCCLRCTLPLRLFIVFCMLLLCASLRSPLIIGPESQWQLLAMDPGGRYWFFPMLAFLWSLVWLATQSKNKPFKAVAIVSLLFMSKGIVHDWRHPAFKDEQFGKYVRQFESSPSGTRLVIPEYPDGVLMRLRKK